MSEKRKESVKRVTKLLPVKLTENELLAAGEKLAEARTRYLQADNELKAIKSEFKGKLEHEESIIGQQVSLIQTKQETREVECDELMDFEDGIVMVTRLDTLEVISQRDITESERQAEMDLNEEDAEEPVDDVSAEAHAEEEVAHV